MASGHFDQEEKKQQREDLRLFSFDLTEDILGPVHKYTRIRYTCFDVSPSFVVFGSTSGGIYLFAREKHHDYHDKLLDRRQLKFLFVIPQIDGKVNCIAFCPHDENIIAFSTSSRTLVVLELQQRFEASPDSAGGIGQGTTPASTSSALTAGDCGWDTIYAANHFTSSCVVTLKWDQLGDHKLFIADEENNIYCIGKLKSLSHLLVSPEPTLLLRTTSKIIDFDVSSSTLVISTLERALVFNIDEGSVQQVGKKGRPIGEFAVCLFPRDVQDNVVFKCIYASRPGSRIWESDLQGNVHFTHQFKSLLSATAPAKILSLDEEALNNLQSLENEETEPTAPSMPTFAQFYLVEKGKSNLLLAHSREPNGLCLIDPVKASVVSWTRVSLDRIKQIRCVGHDIFLFHGLEQSGPGDHTSLRQLSVLSLSECLLTYAQHRKLYHLNKLLLDKEEEQNQLHHGADKDMTLEALFEEENNGDLELKLKLREAIKALWATLSEQEQESEAGKLLQKIFLRGQSNEELNNGTTDAGDGKEEEEQDEEEGEADGRRSPLSTRTQLNAHQIANGKGDECRREQHQHHCERGELLGGDDIETKYFKKMSISVDSVIPLTKLNGTLHKGIERLNSARVQGLDLVMSTANQMANLVTSSVGGSTLGDSQKNGSAQINHQNGDVGRKIASSENSSDGENGLKSIHESMDESDCDLSSSSKGSRVANGRADHRPSNRDEEGRSRKSSFDSNHVPVLSERMKISSLLEKLSNVDMEASKCSCGFPRPGAHLRMSNDQIELKRLIEVSTELSDQECSQIMFDGGLWHLYISNLNGKTDSGQMLKLALMLADLKVLDSKPFSDEIKNNHDLCAKLLNFHSSMEVNAHDKKSLKCLNCQSLIKNVVNSLSLEDCANYLITIVGVNEAIKMLREQSESLQLVELPIDFYLFIVRRQVVEKYQSSLTLSKLSQLNDKLSKQINVIKRQSTPTASQLS